MEKKPLPHHHVYHHPVPHPVPHPALHPSHPLNLSLDSHNQYASTDSHNQYASMDSHNTTVEQFNFENILPSEMAPMAPMAPYQHPYDPGLQVPMALTPESVYPMQQCQTNALENVVIPHVHPSHTTHLMHTHFVNQHFFPHTESCCHTASCEDVFCSPPPPCPCPMPAPGYGYGMHPFPHF
jgi:hypothetical protein